MTMGVPRNGGADNNNGGLRGEKNTQVESMIVELVMDSAGKGRSQRWVVPKVLPIIGGREGP